MNDINPINLWVKPLHPRIKSMPVPLKPATERSAGVDLHAVGGAVIHPGGEVMISTGLAVWIERRQLMGLVLPRSSLGRRGLMLQNTAGIIDCDYQGEILIAARNIGKEILEIKEMERIAQLIIVCIANVHTNLVVEEFPYFTPRGTGGFGSTGK